MTIDALPRRRVWVLLCSAVWSLALLWEANASFVHWKYGFGCFPRGLVAVHPGYSIALLAIGDALIVASRRLRSARVEAALLMSMVVLAFVFLLSGGVDYICDASLWHDR